MLLAPRGPQEVPLQRARRATLGQMGIQAAPASLGLLERLAQRAPQGGPALLVNRESEGLKARRGSRESLDESLGVMAQGFLG